MNPIVNLNHRFYFHGISYAFFLLLLTPLPATAQTNDRTDYGYNNSFKPSMAVTIVILAAAFVFIALFSLYIRRCAREAHMTGGSIRGGNVRSRRAPRGLDPAVIETFPTFVYSVVKGLKIGKGTLECAVCLNEFEDDETLRLLPKCDHVFHPECIDAWLSSHTTCPVCRADLKPGEGSATEASGTNTETETESGSPEVTESQEQVLINVNEEDSSAEMINPTDITRQNRPVRMKSMKARRFSRSHSTGHSVQPGENFDRFTLRLPVDVRKQIINGKLNRSASCVAFVTRQGSVSGSVGEGRSSVLFGGRFERSGKSDRWGFSMAPPFFWRNASVRGSVKSSFDRLGAKAGDSEPPV